MRRWPATPARWRCPSLGHDGGRGRDPAGRHLDLDPERRLRLGVRVQPDRHAATRTQRDVGELGVADRGRGRREEQRDVEDRVGANGFITIRNAVSP